MATRAPGLASTTVRGETLANVNRGRIRGWVGIAAVGLVALAVLSWPDLLSVAVFLAGAVACSVVVVWVHRSLPEVELEREQQGAGTGERD